MGRKKIEIRPLHDERNRNVTFLKRKAGLMKKAWELSVLCGADVSIVIFSAAGKAFEFSSKELDEEIDRYLEYEGVIERRRAPEFAAMAEADEDDDDDDDDAPAGRRGSMAKPPGVTKSLKGKESFKPKMHSQAELARLVAKRERNKEREKHRSKDKHRSREADYARKTTSMRTTVEDGGESSGHGSSGDDDGYGRDGEGKRRRKSREGGSRSHRDASMAGLQYAMNLHNRPSSTTPYPSEQSSLPPIGRLPANAHNFRVQHSSQLDYSHDYSQSQSYPPSSVYGVQNPAYDRSSMVNYLAPLNGSQAIPQHHTLPTPVPMSNGTPGNNLLPGNMQWDPQLLARYAEFQLHQNHQRQQRALLEQQRQQLAELGIPVEDKSLLDQLFGNHPSGTPTGEPGDMATSSANTAMPDEEMASQSYPSTNQSFDSSHQPFEWPTVNAPERDGEERDDGLYKQLTALVNASRSGSQPGDEPRGKEEQWNGEDFAPFPSPASAGDLRAVR